MLFGHNCYTIVMVKKLKLNKWFLLGLLAVLIAAPNATATKYITNSLDPFVYSTLRFGLIAIVTAPYILLSYKKFNSKNLRYALTVGVLMSIAVLVYVWAIKLSQASYVSIITLLTPIIFVILSAKLTGEKIKMRGVAGITLAALGAFIIVALPIALRQNSSLQFYPLASALALLNTITFPLAIIYSKKANENGLPLMSIFSVSAWVVLLVSVLCTLIFASNINVELNPGLIAATCYSGIIVALVARMLNVASYEHIGSAVSSALAYTETLLAIVIPVILLGEKLSIEMVLGGVCILLGVYLAEHHQSKHKKHYLFFKSH